MAAFLSAAATDGIVGILYARVAADRMLDLPPAVVDGLRAGALRQAATELIQRFELQRVVAALHGDGIDAILLKGASLAYDIYTDPSWRVRSDVDLLIRPHDRRAVKELLHGLGYHSRAAQSGELVAAQFHCERTADGVRHLCDVHWQLFNRLRFADAIPFEALANEAIPLPQIGTGARGLGRVHAIWLACVHRAAHHFDQDTLLWLYDVHLLAERLTSDDFRRFVALARRTGTRRICLRGLELARARLSTAVPDDVIAALEAGSADEASTVFLDGGIRGIDLLRDDLRVLSWRSRFQLVKEHLLPPADYMREGYAPGSSAPLAFLYLARFVAGTRRWLSALRRAAH